MLQAENEEEYQEWVHALRSQTEALLGLGLATHGSSSSSGGGSSGGGLGVSPPSSPNRGQGTHAAFVERVRRLNPYCADCGAPGADWAVINAGVSVCIQCSGCHRALGVHLSKVRSLTLDRWPRALRLVMEGVGNARFNAVWEASAPQQGSKPPGPAASREEREAWIRDKYVGRLFVAQGEPTPPLLVGGEEEQEGQSEDPDVILYHAARRGDVGALLWALAHGADVNWAHPGQRGRTAVHAVCEGAAGGGGDGGGMQGRLVCLELLAQNGACLDAVDQDELSPLDVAMHGSSTPLLEKEASAASSSSSLSWQRTQQLQQLNQLSVGSVGSCSNMSLVSYLLAKLK
jgi:hypothetical protein